jgi:hypothetical protein
MYLEKLAIKNFRSFEECEVLLSRDLTIFVGENILFYPILLYSTLPHSHSIVLMQDNALIHRPTISTAAISGERQSHFLLEPRFR